MSQADIFRRRLEPLEHWSPLPAIRSPAGLEPAHVPAPAGDDEDDPTIAIVVARDPARDRVVVRVKREEGHADCVELVVARRVRVVRPRVREGEGRGGAGAVDRDERVELAHRRARVGVREERGERAREGRVGELPDRVGVLRDEVFQVGAEALGVGGAGEPVGFQAALTRCCNKTKEVRTVGRSVSQLAGCKMYVGTTLGTYDCAVFTVSQGWDGKRISDNGKRRRFF